MELIEIDAVRYTLSDLAENHVRSPNN